MTDKIIIQDLEVRSHLGITAAERLNPQRLLISIEIAHSLKKAGSTDHLRHTIDYDAVARAVRTLAGKKERNLIEALAEETAAMVLNEFNADTVVVQVKKFVLPDTQFVAVQIERHRIGA